MARGGKAAEEAAAGVIARLARGAFGDEARTIAERDAAHGAGDATRTATRDASKPIEPYNRRKHYGNTPTAADRRAVGAGPGEVADHDPPLVKRYYEGDPAKGEPPGHTMDPDQRRASAGDRDRMSPQPRAESDSQGGQMSAYSRQKKKELGL